MVARALTGNASNTNTRNGVELDPDKMTALFGGILSAAAGLIKMLRKVSASAAPPAISAPSDPVPSGGLGSAPSFANQRDGSGQVVSGGYVMTGVQSVNITHNHSSEVSNNSGKITSDKSRTSWSGVVLLLCGVGVIIYVLVGSSHSDSSQAHIGEGDVGGYSMPPEPEEGVTPASSPQQLPGDSASGTQDAGTAPVEPVRPSKQRGGKPSQDLPAASDAGPKTAGPDTREQPPNIGIVLPVAPSATSLPPAPSPQ